MFRVLRLTDIDKGAIIAAPSDGFAMFFVAEVDRERTHCTRYNSVGVREFVEGVPEEPGLALFRVREGDLLGGTYFHFMKDGVQEAPWERPWWDRLAADPRPIFILAPPWEVYIDMNTEGTREPPPMPTKGVEMVDHYDALRRAR